MTPAIRVTPRAVEDLRNIGRYTAAKWGRIQRDAYLRGIQQRLLWLAERPQRGRHRTDIAAGYYSFRHEAHLIFYLIADDGIDIIGIPHQAMDLPAHFEDEDI